MTAWSVRVTCRFAWSLELVVTHDRFVAPFKPYSFLLSFFVQVHVSVLLEALQDRLVSGLLEEKEQVIRSQPHGGGVSHGVEVDHLVASLHQVLVQDELHTAVLIKEQS